MVYHTSVHKHAQTRDVDQYLLDPVGHCPKRYWFGLIMRVLQLLKI